MAADPPFFTYERQLKPLPDEPIRCRDCRQELEPLRRYAGLCKQCVAQRANGRVVKPPTDKLMTRMVVVRMLYRERMQGGQRHRERYVEVRCECGCKRVLPWRTWQHHRPQSCNRCRLSGIATRGFEAEYAR